MTITAAIIVAAGQGRRAGTEAGPAKQYRRIGGEMMLSYGLRAFCTHPRIGYVLCVIARGDEAHYEMASRGLGGKLLRPVMGGDTRQQSVHAGLRALAPMHPDKVLIHDAARPFIDATTISGVIDTLDEHAACLAGEPVSDTLKLAESGMVMRTMDRTGLWRAQTPQGFHFAAILDAHERAATAEDAVFTDDASIAEWAGIGVRLVPGSPQNWKVTTPGDIAMAERLLGAPAALFETRTGSGFDVHRFTPGDSVRLCGMSIPHDQALEGHSDADVGLHALTDALLGAIGAGDIGAHFPPSDPQWRGAASDIFLRHAADEIARRGGRIINADVTLICEAPKIGPHREAMRAAIADILSVPVARISVKATTSEQLGFTGRREGIAALATASVAMRMED